jgi:hypothetical protein
MFVVNKILNFWKMWKHKRRIKKRIEEIRKMDPFIYD